MLISNLFSLIGCVAALKGRNVESIEKRQATAAKQYTVYTIDQPVCYLPIHNFEVDFMLIGLLGVD